jgi:hypothetical protein
MSKKIFKITLRVNKRTFFEKKKKKKKEQKKKKGDKLQVWGEALIRIRAGEH